MKTKRLVRVDPLNLQIRKPKTRFNLKMAIAYSRFHETMTLTSRYENTEKRTIVYKDLSDCEKQRITIPFILGNNNLNSDFKEISLQKPIASKCFTRTMRCHWNSALDCLFNSRTPVHRQLD